MNKSVVLLSGGLDSTVNAAEAARLTQVVTAVTFNYGQAAAIRELEAAETICRRLELHHTVIDLPWLTGSRSALTGGSLLTDPDITELDDVKSSKARAETVWVPNRNGLFLNIAACLAESKSADLVIPGFNAEEAVAFPDNSRDFINAQNKALKYSTRARVAVECYTSDLNKTAVAEMGKNNNAPLDLVWSCYRGQDRMCGRCESCLRLKRAYSQAGISGLLDGRMES